jgi:hypothetical protein
MSSTSRLDAFAGSLLVNDGGDHLCLDKGAGFTGETALMAFCVYPSIDWTGAGSMQTRDQYR